MFRDPSNHHHRRSRGRSAATHVVLTEDTPTMKHHQATITEAEHGGHIAIVKLDGLTLYASDIAHGSTRGVFGSEDDAQRHADTIAELLDAKAAEIARVRRVRSDQFASEVMVLKCQVAEDRDLAKTLQGQAKTARGNADAREERITALAGATHDPRVRLDWYGSGPTDVRLTPEPSAWDEPFLEEQVSPNQLSIPGVSWEVAAPGGDLMSLVGYGRVTVTRSGDSMTVTLGAREHTITITGGSVAYSSDATARVEAANSAPPTARAKPSEQKGRSKPAPFRIKSVSAGALIERLELIERPETLLAIYIREAQQTKPRAAVMAAISKIADKHDVHQLAIDISAIDDGRGTQITPDRAAATLITMVASTPVVALEEVIPECNDAVVLGLVLDGELDRNEDADDTFVAVLRSRLADLGPTATAEDVAQIH